MKVILCLLAFLSAAVAQLSFPQQYEADVVIMLPYANIEEPVSVWYDGMNNMSKFSYYGGADVYLLRGDLSNSFEVVPTTVNGSVPYTTCFVSSGAVTAQSIFPNPTGFVLQNGTQTLDGVECNVWTLVQTSFNRSSTYTVFTRASDNIPMQYRMLGYDSLLGSHYDEYVVFYKSVVPSLSDPSVFNKPSIPCVNEFGSSQFQLDAGAMFPENAAFIDSYVNGEFEAFKSKHGRSYADEFEHTQRRHNFFNNMRYVNSMNRKRLSYTLKLNHLSDLSRKERLARLNKMPKAANNGASAVHEITTKPEDLPQELDWWKLGAVTPVMDQGICGSCWAHGAIETIEGSVFLATGNLTRLSPQALMDCSWSFGNTACDGGQDYLGYQWIITAGGVPTAASYPYLMADGYCHYPENGMVTGARISGYVNVTSGSEEALLDACFTRGPISISIDASQDSFSFYSSGVYYEPACKNGVNDLDHNVLLTGFGVENGQPYWLVKNSWSTHWGDNGYVKMSRLNNNCGVETGPTYVNILL